MTYLSLEDLLMAKYDGDIDDNVLLEGAMKGMASALNDPYTVYMNSEEYVDFVESNNKLLWNRSSNWCKR